MLIGSSPHYQLSRRASKLEVFKTDNKGHREKNKNKNTLYAIDDRFFGFWLRFIYPNPSDVEGGDEDNSFVGFAFEDVRKEFLIKLNKDGFLPMRFEKIGRWWGHYREEGARMSAEIDLVALNEETGEILFAECEWKSDVDVERTLGALKEKVRYVKWHNKNRKEFYCILAKSFKKKLNKKCFIVRLERFGKSIYLKG